MPLYRYYFFDIDGEVRDVRAVERRDDLAAIEQAREFLAFQKKHIAIEIWRPQGFVTGVRRDGTLYDHGPTPIQPSSPSRSKRSGQ